MSNLVADFGRAIRHKLPHHRSCRIGILWGLLLFYGAGSEVAEAQEPRLAVDELAMLTLEQLSNIRVTTVSGTKERLSTAPAAVAVVTSKEIRRSGATSVPEVLRLVPGIYVARQSASIWAVSARGFSSANSRNLLVLSDGRSIYTPLFSGVFWDAQDYLMANIDRIEVVRGPGASLWGSNAVNGVVNIITKHARETQGLYTEAILGTEQQEAAVRYGGEMGLDGYYRVFVKHTEHDNSFAPNAQSEDDWRISHFGFRTDWETGVDEDFTIQGDLYEGNIGQLVPAVRLIGQPGPQGQLEAEIRGGNIQGRWQHQLDSRSSFELSAYYDRTYRDDPAFEDTLETVDIDFQHHILLGARHELLWGVNYRFYANENRGKGIFAVLPEESDDERVSVFVQDQIALFDSLQLTLGTKLEENDFSGFEIQPTARAAWNIAPGQTAWAAVSRAVRVPTRYERDVSIDAGTGPNGEIIRLVGNEEFNSEETLAYEVGYRWFGDDWSVDLAAFYNQYDGISSLEFGETFEDDGQTVIPLIATNMTDGDSHGVEALVNYTPMASWRLTASYSYLDMDLEAQGQDINFGELIEGSTPRHQFSIRSAIDWRNYQFDIRLRHLSEVRSIPAVRTGETVVPAYTEMAIRIARYFGDRVVVSVVGKNLLDSQHPEFGSEDVRGEVERSVYGKVVVRF